ncbi:hypothetical protein RUND412_007395 [Rhizina undulata]
MAAFSPLKPHAPSAPDTADFNYNYNTSGNIFISKDNLILLLNRLQAQLRERNEALNNYNRKVQCADKIAGAFAIGLEMAKDVQSAPIDFLSLVGMHMRNQVLVEMEDVSDAEPDDEFGKLQEKLLAGLMKDSINELEDKQENSEVVDVIEQLKSHTAANYKARKLKQIQKELYVAPQPTANYPGVGAVADSMGLNEDNHTYNQKIETNLQVPAHMGNSRNIAPKYECEKSLYRSMPRYESNDENPWEQLEDPIFEDIERQKKRWTDFQASDIAKSSREFEKLANSSNGSNKTSSFNKNNDFNIKTADFDKITSSSKKTNNFKSPREPASAKPTASSPAREPLKTNHGELRQIFFRGLPRNITYAQLSAYIHGGKLECLQIFADKNRPANAQAIFFHAKDAHKFHDYFNSRPRYIDGHQVSAELDPYRRLGFGLCASNVSRVLMCKKVPDHVLKAGKKEFEESLRRYWDPRMGRCMGIESVERVVENGKVQLVVTFTNVKTAIKLKNYQLFRNMEVEYGVDPCGAMPEIEQFKGRITDICIAWRNN